MGFGGSFDASDAVGTVRSSPRMGRIAAGQSVTANHKLNLSLFTAGKMLPLRYAPMEFELTLADPGWWLGAGTNAGTSYTISDVQLIYDSAVLDEAVQESFYKALLSNRVLNIPCQIFFQTVSAVPSGSTNLSLSIVRAFSRLSHV